jgi:ribosomal protein S18 acetylase RimI-like enzyme
MDTITFPPLQPEEIDDLILVAHKIWHAHYPGIITIEQIDYMLERGYTSVVIREEIETKGIFWNAIKDDSAIIGMISVGPYGDSVMKLHKLYLLPEYHGMGIGSRALEMAEQIAQRQNAATLVLNVNRHNPKAISAYKRAGWKIAGETVVEIGNGYVMDDYVMSKALTS